MIWPGCDARNGGLGETKASAGEEEEEKAGVPAIHRVVVLDGGLHVLQLVEHGKHVEHLAQREQIGLTHELRLTAPLPRVAQAPRLFCKALDSAFLQAHSENVLTH